MAIDSSWDTEKYRTKFEPADHWELKKEFIEFHKKNVQEDRLACLAQVCEILLLCYRIELP